MPVIFTREICMPEVNTEFLFTIALEIQVFSLGDQTSEWRQSMSDSGRPAHEQQ
jgi:hypothetical protein